MHVESRSVGEDLPTSFNRAEDVGPHFFGELGDGGSDDLPGLTETRFLLSASPSVRCGGGGHVSERPDTAPQLLIKTHFRRSLATLQTHTAS